MEITGSGKIIGFQSTRVLRITQSVTSLNVLHTYNCDDVTSLSGSQLGTVIRVHLNHTADTLGFASEGVQDGVTLIQNTGVDTDKGQGTETVIHDLECQCAQWLISRNGCNFTSRLTRLRQSEAERQLRLETAGSQQQRPEPAEHLCS